MVIYHCIKRIWRILVAPNFPYNLYERKTIYPGEPVNIHIQSLIKIIQDKNREINTKKG